MMTILENIPAWVFPLFAGLLFLGLRASQRRRVPVVLICALPFMGILTFQNIQSLSADAWIWGAAIAVYGAGMVLGHTLQKGWIIEKAGQFVEVRGEWVTLAAMMALFAAGFVLGFVKAVAPELVSNGVFALGFVIIVSLAAGQFMGRAVATLWA